MVVAIWQQVCICNEHHWEHRDCLFLFAKERLSIDHKPNEKLNFKLGKKYTFVLLTIIQDFIFFFAI